MKTKGFEKCICLLFCAFLGGIALLFLLLPRRDFSENEKRYLADAPALTWENVFSGRFGREAESYAADHLPGRDFFVGLNAWYDLTSGRQTSKEIYRGKSGRLYEAPAAMDRAQIARNIEAVNEFARTVGQPVDLMLVPSAGAVLPEDMPLLADPYPDREILSAAATMAEGPVRVFDLLPLFEGAADRGALFYRTDHHWTSRGAQLACAAYLEQKGRESLRAEDYDVAACEGFAGTAYSRSALWGTPPESIELWDSGGSFTVENLDAPGTHAGLFYPEHLQRGDKYPVYLDGNHSLVRIRNPQGQGKLLVIRDSFANCMGCFLADAYGELVLVDLRYYRAAVSPLLEEEHFDDVLVLYGVNNFMSDANLMRLE